MYAIRSYYGKDGLNSVNVKGKHSWDGLSTNYDDYAKNANADKDYEHGDYIDDLFEELADTLMKKIPAKIGNEAFTTTLAPIAYLGAFYDVNHYFGVGALSRSTFYTDGFRQDFRFSANLNLYHVLTTTVNYNWTINGSNDLGFGIALRGGPFQFYFMLDHIPVTYDEIIIDGDTYPSPRKFDTVTFMTGINFLFGPNGYKDKPMVDSYSEY